LKNFRANSAFRVGCSKTLNDKKYFNRVKIFRATLFFRASASGSKILNNKNYSGHTLFFRASASCSKILNVKNIFNQGRTQGGGDLGLKPPLELDILRKVHYLR